MTVGASFLSQTIALQDSTTVKFEIWDTAGQERYNWPNRCNIFHNVNFIYILIPEYYYYVPISTTHPEQNPGLLVFKRILIIDRVPCRYAALAPLYYRGAAVAVVVYDITSPDSFAKAQYWVKVFFCLQITTIAYLLCFSCYYLRKWILFYSPSLLVCNGDDGIVL